MSTRKGHTLPRHKLIAWSVSRICSAGSFARSRLLPPEGAEAGGRAPDWGEVGGAEPAKRASTDGWGQPFFSAEATTQRRGGGGAGGGLGGVAAVGICAGAAAPG